MPVSIPTQQLIASVNRWWHSIPVAPGVVTPGHKTPEILAKELQQVPLHLVRGKTVLDIGAWDGFFSFAAEAAGASRVVSLDHYAWANDFGTGPAARASPYWEEKWPGKIGFNVARALRGSHVESMAEDFMAMDPSTIGAFDVVFFFGVLYHMRHPLLSLERVCEFTRELAVIETEAMEIRGSEHSAYCEFFERRELNDDDSNWWSPNIRALCGMIRAAGFSRAEPVITPSLPTDAHWKEVRYRVHVLAWK